MIWPRYDVFFSYSRSDSERVIPLRDELRRMGYRVFFDVESIDPSSPWRERLRKAIRKSRTLMLCWSEHTRVSDYVNFEYMQAEALHRPIFPWRLDKTPLPPMLEAQAINIADATQVAARIQPTLGRTLGQRRSVWAAAMFLLLAVVGVALWIAHRPPPPWMFQGEVTDHVTGMPIAGAEVDVMKGDDIQTSTFTDTGGLFHLPLPQPQPKSIYVRFRDRCYETDEKAISTGKTWPEDLLMVQPLPSGCASR